ncbi:MAG: phosphoglycolate phosphatase [Pseudolabrys sp.]|nr:phosphoglycolate phosphatase [Pseudolabrys sp.]
MPNHSAQPVTIVFDLDGTLVDTAPDLIATLNFVFKGEGLPPVDYATARLAIGGGAKRMIARGLEIERRVVAPDLVERLFVQFIDYYSDHIADHSRPFPGLEKALDRLAARGFTLAVCTNKLEGLSLQLLRTLRLADRFAAICGQDTFGVQKPDPAILRRTIERAGGDTSHAVMIGDSETDVLTARATKVPVVAVDFGYSDPPVAEFHPDRLIGHFDALDEAIEGVMSKPHG